MDVLQGEELIWTGHPSWRMLMIYYVKYTIISLIPAAIWVALNAVMNNPPSSAIFFGVTLVALVCTYVIGWLRLRTTTYNLTTTRIHVRTGIVSRQEHSAQLSRVQNVNVSQTMFQRMLGIGDVDWDTAGTEEASSEFRFRGVDDPSRLSRIVDEKLHEAETRA
jgi:uncharacterized membrane protein YdbT with pleckstrin-like domain